MIVMIFEITILPLQYAFSYPDNETYMRFQVPVLGVLFMDIVCDFFKAYNDQGVIIYDQKACFKQYWRTDFLQDLVLWLLFFLAILYDIRWLQMVILFTFWNRVNNEASNLVELMNLREKMGNEAISLIGLLTYLFFIAHNLACFIFWIGAIQQTQDYDSSNSYYQISWLDYFGVRNQYWTYQYITSIYLQLQSYKTDFIQLPLFLSVISVFTMMTTIGFGDISPKSSLERVVMCGIMCFSAGFFGYAMGSIGNIVNSYKAKSEEHEIRQMEINTYMNYQQIPEELQQKVRGYLEYLHLQEKKQLFNKDSVVECLSQSLKEEILIEVNQSAIKSMKVLEFSDQLMERLSLCLKEKTFFPDEKIFQENNTNERCIYYITSGQVIARIDQIKRKVLTQGHQEQAIQANLRLFKVHFPQTGQKKKQYNLFYKENESFGEREFFTGEPRQYTVVCKNVTRLSYIQYDDFQSLIREFTPDMVKNLKNFSFISVKFKKEQFNSIRENLLLKNYNGLKNFVCLNCKRSNHSFLECEQIFYSPDQDLIYKKNNISRTHMYRKKFKRRTRPQFNSKFRNMEVQDKLYDFMIDNQIDFEDIPEDEDDAPVRVNEQNIVAALLGEPSEIVSYQNSPIGFHNNILEESQGSQQPQQQQHQLHQNQGANNYDINNGDNTNQHNLNIQQYPNDQYHLNYNNQPDNFTNNLNNYKIEDNFIYENNNNYLNIPNERGGGENKEEDKNNEKNLGRIMMPFVAKKKINSKIPAYAYKAPQENLAKFPENQAKDVFNKFDQYFKRQFNDNPLKKGDFSNPGSLNLAGSEGFDMQKISHSSSALVNIQDQLNFQSSLLNAFAGVANQLAADSKIHIPHILKNLIDFPQDYQNQNKLQSYPQTFFQDFYLQSIKSFQFFQKHNNYQSVVKKQYIRQPTLLNDKQQELKNQKQTRQRMTINYDP